MGISVAIAAPKIDVDYYRLNSGMQTVASQMLSAQSLAIKSQHNVIVAFDSTGARIRIHADRNNNGAMDAGEPVSYSPLGDGLMFGSAGAPAASLLGANRVIGFNGSQGGLPAVTFRRGGSASEEGGFLITTRRAEESGRPDRARGVIIERATGRTTWHRYEGSSWKNES